MDNADPMMMMMTLQAFHSSKKRQTGGGGGGGKEEGGGGEAGKQQTREDEGTGEEKQQGPASILPGESVSQSRMAQTGKHRLISTYLHSHLPTFLPTELILRAAGTAGVRDTEVLRNGLKANPEATERLQVGG